MGRSLNQRLMFKYDKEHNAKIQIVLVDDNEDAAFVNGRLLEHFGFDIRICFDGQECIQMVYDRLPDVILLDIEMHELDGYQVCKILREQVWGKHLAIIAFTSLDVSYQDKFLAGGFDAYVGKPADYHQLIKTIVDMVAAKDQAW